MSVLSDCVRTLMELMSTVTVMFIDGVRAMQRKVEASLGHGAMGALMSLVSEISRTRRRDSRRVSMIAAGCAQTFCATLLLKIRPSCQKGCMSII